MTAAVGWRERVSRRLPASWKSDPFECMISALSVLVGAAVLLDLLAPGSLLTYLPPEGLNVWGGFLLAGGLTIMWGLLRGGRPLVLAAGLRLLAFLFAAYAVAVVPYTSLRQGGLSAALIGAAAALCFARSFYHNLEQDRIEHTAAQLRKNRRRHGRA